MMVWSKNCAKSLVLQEHAKNTSKFSVCAHTLKLRVGTIKPGAMNPLR